MHWINSFNYAQRHIISVFLIEIVEMLWLYFVYNSQQLIISAWYIQRTLHVILSCILRM